MSSNVVSIFDRPKAQVAPKPVTTDTTEVIQQIIQWSQAAGIDVVNDYGFLVRTADFMTYLQLAAKESQGSRVVNGS